MYYKVVDLPLPMGHGPDRHVRATAPVAFDPPISRVVGCLYGWRIETTRNAAVKELAVEIKSTVLSGDKQNVEVEVVFMYKDHTGNADDDYKGNAKVLLIGD